MTLSALASQLWPALVVLIALIAVPILIESLVKGWAEHRRIRRELERED